MSERLKITLAGVVAHTTERPKQNGWLVTHTIHRGFPETNLAFSSFIPDDYAEENIVTIARSQLAWVTERVAGERADWKVSPEDHERYKADRDKPKAS